MNGVDEQIVIVGAGFAGVGLAIRLQQAGIEDFTILDRAATIGGTWRDNTYPGCACDVPAQLYSYSFAPNPYWSRTYATQPEILAYLERCTDQYGLRSHLRTGVEINEARWDDAERQWRLVTSTGDEITADVVVSGLGMLNIPVVPDIPGADRFRGRMFHSSRWDHSK